MKLVIISNAPIVIKNGKDYLYAPYLKEVRLWAKHVESIEFCCPIWKKNETLLVEQFKKSEFYYTFRELYDFNITTPIQIIKTIIALPKILYTLFIVMKNADHIHLRCPGNVGLLACLVQIFFPSKPKTAKYAGNWDPKAKQPWSYRLQKWILNNTFLTRNMQVLVYGNWEGTSKNIKPFFTATYTESEAEEARSLLSKKILGVNDTIKFIFVGTLSEGKRPIYALKLWHQLVKYLPNSTIEFYGEGTLRNELKEYIQKNNLDACVILKGNQTKEIVEKAYKKAHFLFLASKSEGWPKVVAEAMFWGCVPLTTNISCVNEMIGNGSRGILLSLNDNEDIENILNCIKQPELYSKMSELGKKWSAQYTVEKFEIEIKKLMV